jgi:hypothetical protein
VLVSLPDLLALMPLSAWCLGAWCLGAQFARQTGRNLKKGKGEKACSVN